MTRDILRARWSSRCEVCKQEIVPGDAITLERSPSARHDACAYPEPAPSAAPAAPPSRWAAFEGRMMVVRDKHGNEMTGKIRHHRNAAYDNRPAADFWGIELNRTFATPARRTYLRELRDTDQPVREYAMSGVTHA